MRISGIGSRKTPSNILAEMMKVGEYALNNGWTVTSGHAAGADYAFEIGAKKNCIAYLPWDGFNSSLPMLGTPIVVPHTTALDDIVRKFHPAPDKLSSGGWALMRRNAYQVLGEGLDQPVDAVVCWTEDGKASGGTGQAMRIAEAYNIKVINMFQIGLSRDVISSLV